MQATNYFADAKSARHGQIQDKEKTPTTEMKIFFSKFFFQRKIK